MNSIVIWGAGTIGDAAWYYYKNICNIVCYIDSDERKWGQKLNGIAIKPPSALKNIDAEVILALKGGADNVRKQLAAEYGIKKSVWFQIYPKEYYLDDNFTEVNDDTCIVGLSGGLGNQMFQYAFIKNLQQHGKKVLIDLSLNAGINVISIADIFAAVKLNVCTEIQKTNLIQSNIHRMGQKQKKFILYKENSIYETKEKCADLSILDNTGGIFQGLFQTYRFAEAVRDLLLIDFKFKIDCDSKLQKISDFFKERNVVSVHIRRGDYLTESNRWIYGDICTDEYYQKAMEYFKGQRDDCIFAFFSNDIEWVKKNYNMENTVYIERDMFEDYQDWYDMYLMSICKHNIIANSTFSWWGAWLNQNENKIVIVPKKWVNQCNYKDIYPIEWMQI